MPETPPTHARTLPAAPELRGDRRVVFYAAVFGEPARVAEHGRAFTEVVAAGAFRRHLADPAAAAVYACVRHDPATTFARTGGGGLYLEEDARGLFATCYLPAGEVGDRVRAGVLAGRLDGASFRFRDAPGGRTVRPDGVEVVTDVDLVDVCLAAGDAVYKGTAVSLRTRPPGAAGTLGPARARLLRLRG